MFIEQNVSVNWCRERRDWHEFRDLVYFTKSAVIFALFERAVCLAQQVTQTAY